MTETMEVETAGDGLIIDKSRQYKPNAGQCGNCGHFKTWEFRIANAKTGKQMPGHVTKEGFKIGDGNCPYWQKNSKTNAKKEEKKASPEPRPAGAWIEDITGSTPVATPTKSTRQVTQATPSPTPAVASLVTGDAIMVKIGPMSIKLNRKDALAAARNILEQLTTQEW